MVEFLSFCVPYPSRVVSSLAGDVTYYYSIAATNTQCVFDNFLHSFREKNAAVGEAATGSLAAGRVGTLALARNVIYLKIVFPMYCSIFDFML